MGACLCTGACKLPGGSCPAWPEGYGKHIDEQKHFFMPNKGWECPKCSAVMSPSYPTCFYCRPQEQVTITSIRGPVWVKNED